VVSRSAVRSAPDVDLARRRWLAARHPSWRHAAYYPGMGSEREDAWAALLDVVPAGWQVGRASYHDERREWDLYAFDPSERPKVGVRSREWIAKASTEEGVVRKMARCLAALRRGETPQ
jgi:hypothetical protein